MTQKLPADQKLNEQRVHNLPFEIIAEPQNNINQLANKNVPLNFKIRIKTKKEPKMKQTVISVPRLNTSQRSKNVRLVNSDQTIMSFDLFVDPYSAPKKRENFFSSIFKTGCLMQNDEDEDPYVPSASHNASKIHNIRDGNVNELMLDVTENFALRKTFIPASNTTNLPKTFLGQCKAGGCLDPPFGEDRYAYKPAHILSNTKFLSNDNLNTSMEKIKNISLNEPLDSQINKKIRDSVISDSLITYPHNIPSSKTNSYEGSQNSGKEPTNSSIRLLDNEFTQLYYMPKKTDIKEKHEENQDEKYTDRKIVLDIKDEVLDIKEEEANISLLNLSGEIKMTELKAVNENLLKDHELFEPILSESTSHRSKISVNIENKLYKSVLHKDEKIDYKLNDEAKSRGELTPLTVTIKEPLNISIDKNDNETEKNNLSDIDQSKDMNKNKLFNKYENFSDDQIISSEKSYEDQTVDLAVEKANIFKFNSDGTRDGNENKMTINIGSVTSVVIASPKEHYFEKSTEDYTMSIQDEDIDENIEHKTKNLKYVANDNKAVKINEIYKPEQKPMQSLSEVKINDLNRFSIDDKSNTTPENIDEHDQNINEKDIKDKSTEQVYSRISNETTKLDADNNITMINSTDVLSTASLKIGQDSLPILNTSNISSHSKISELDDIEKNIMLREKNDQDDNYAQTSSAIKSSLKIDKDALSLSSNSIKSSSSKQSRLDLTKSKILSEPKNENDNETVKNILYEKQQSVLFHDINKTKSVDEDSNDEMHLENIDDSEFLEKNRVFEIQNKNVDARVSEDVADITNLKVNMTDPINLSQSQSLQSVNTIKKSIPLISSINQNIYETRSETYSNNNIEDKPLAEYARRNISDMSLNKNTLSIHDLTKSDQGIKKYTSLSFTSIKAIGNKLQKDKNINYDKISTTRPEHNIIDKEIDKTKPENIESTPILEKFQSSKNLVDDSTIQITNDYKKILYEMKNSVDNLESTGKIPHKDLYSSYNGSTPSITINLDLHMSSNDDNSKIFIRTFDPILPPEKHLEDKFISIKRKVTDKDEEIKIPINSDIDFTMKIEKKTSSRKILNQTNDIHKTFSEGNINNNSLLHDRLNSVYDNLLPLKEIINNLRTEIKLMSQQQIQFIELLNKMETKPLRLIDNTQKCKCYKQKLTDMYIYYG